MDRFGPATAPSFSPNFKWYVVDESDVYKKRDLDSIKLPALPTDATKKRGWDISVLTQVQKIDSSDYDVLTKWMSACLDVVGSDVHEALMKFNENSQGLTLLDR